MRPAGFSAGPASIRLVAAPMIETSGVLRSWLTEDRSAGAQPFGLRQQPRLLHVAGQLRALDGDRDLVDQRIEKAMLLGVEKRSVAEFDAEQAVRLLRRFQRQEQPGRGRQRR